MSETPPPVVTIIVEGHVDDLCTLALLFREGALPDLRVETGLTGAKDGSLDRVTNADAKDTFVCLPLTQASSIDKAG